MIFQWNKTKYTSKPRSLTQPPLTEDDPKTKIEIRSPDLKQAQPPKNAEPPQSSHKWLLYAFGGFILAAVGQNDESRYSFKIHNCLGGLHFCERFVQICQILCC